MGLYPSEPCQQIWKGEKRFSISDFLLFVLCRRSHHSICNSAQFMKMEADGAVQPGHHVARRKTCFRERSREMLEDICVFETSGSPGDAGSGPSNLAVLIVNSQHGAMKVRPGDLFSFLSFNFWGVQSLLCVSGEGDVGKSMLMSKAKVMPCRSLSPASGWGWWWDGGVSWQLGLWEDAGPLASLALMYEQLEAAHPPSTSGKILNNARRQRRREDRMLQIAKEQISSFSAGRQPRAVDVDY